ncbi:DEKNAAC100246 [Brettanomyces naardenensis]|uniref:DEKNAAC100246 n=1 Tax=Brettanomyces naardenensis TaxID=13370 RepID=A0A448YGM5_BRENA|nr:DEKNAAC100246 [Brettanomyces naardenensis]
MSPTKIAWRLAVSGKYPHNRSVSPHFVRGLATLTGGSIAGASLNNLANALPGTTAVSSAAPTAVGTPATFPTAVGAPANFPTSVATPATFPTLLPTPLQLYNHRVKSGELRSDEYQRGILSDMDQLYSQLQHYHPPTLAKPGDSSASSNPLTSFISSWFRSTRVYSPHNIADDSDTLVPRGIYLFGDVGCGKTMLMDLFYQTIPPHLTKKRLHFHRFMQQLHKRTHQLKQEHADHDIDVMPILAWELAQEATVLCFDEFQVTDVADAMLLRRLLDLVLRSDHGLVLFTTSNRAPDDLYINGIQRESFLPCIEEIKTRTHVVNLNSPTDYRRVPRPVCPVYYSPKFDVSYNAKDSLKQRKHHVDTWYTYFSQGHQIEYRVPIRIWGRELTVPKCSPPYVARFSFQQLCGMPYAAGDYLALASDFESIIVTDIPYLSVDSRDEVRRFITFLDAVYDNHSRLAVTAAAPFEDIFVEPGDIGEDGFTLSEQGKAKLEASKNSATSSVDDDPLVKDHGFDKNIAEKANLFAKLDEERFAFARALSRLKQMSTQAWVDSVTPKEHSHDMASRMPREEQTHAD